MVWLKIFDYPFWPAIVLHPQWLSPSLSSMLKLNKKKTQNRLIAQFFDDRDSSYASIFNFLIIQSDRWSEGYLLSFRRLLQRLQIK